MDGIAPPPLTATAPATLRPLPDDLAQLRLLSVLHYVMAGFITLFSAFPLMYLGMGIAVLSGALPVDGSKASTPTEAQLMGWVFTGLGVVFLMGMLGMAGLIACAGRGLARQQRHTLCLVAAGVCCMCMPLGTVLGVFTLVVLTRSSVRERFAHPSTP